MNTNGTFDGQSAAGHMHLDQSGHGFLDARVGATPNPATIALGVNSTQNYNFANLSGVSLGAYANVTYSGPITPSSTSAARFRNRSASTRPLRRFKKPCA